MKNWLKQTSTIGGFLTLAITGVQAYQSGGDVLTAVLAVLTAALLLTRDGKFLKGLSAFALFITVSSCTEIPVPKDVQEVAAITAVCASAQKYDCFKELQGVLPGIDENNCIERVRYLMQFAKQLAADHEDVNDLVENWDPNKLNLASVSKIETTECGKIGEALGF